MYHRFRLVLSSASTHLRILLENVNCSFTHSPDGSIIIVKAPSDSFISSTEIQLKKELGDEILSSSVASSGTSSRARIRVDSFFPLVFAEDETFQVFPSSILAFDKNDARQRAELRLKLTLNSEATPTAIATCTAALYSEKLIVGGTVIPVSKELLLLSSPFFDRLFNANFGEKISGVYEIGDINADEFRSFIDAFHRRNWQFDSMDHALQTLHFADRFELLYLHSRVLPYLKKTQLPEEYIKDTLFLCAKFKRIDDLITWVLHQCKTDQQAMLLLHECSLELPANVVQVAFKALISISQREKNKVASAAVQQTKVCLAAMKNKHEVLFHMQGYDANNALVQEVFFTLLDGFITREQGGFYKATSKIVVVHAFLD